MKFDLSCKEINASSDLEAISPRHAADQVYKIVCDWVGGNEGNFSGFAKGPVPFEQWPIWAKAAKWISKPEDKGVGDVIARTIGDENSEAFKKWYKATTGKDCGCPGRQALWNAQYPLPIDLP